MKLTKFIIKENIREANKNAGIAQTSFSNNDKVKMLHRVVMDKRLKISEARIYSHLLNHDYQLTQEMISEDLGISRSTVNRSLARLKELEYIDITLMRVESERDKPKTQAIYTLYRNPGIMNIDKLIMYISKLGTMIDKERIDLIVRSEYKRFKFEKLYNLNYDYEANYEDKEIEEAYNVLVFGAYLEMEHGAIYKTSNFITNAIVDLDRYTEYTDSSTILKILTIYKEKLLSRKYSMYELMGTLNIRHAYSANKKDATVNRLHNKISELISHIQQMCDDKEATIEPTRLLEEVKNLAIVIEKEYEDSFKNKDEIKIAQEYSLEQVILTSMLCNNATSSLFYETYHISLGMLLSIISDYEVYSQYLAWTRYKEKHPFMGIKLDSSPKEGEI